MNYKDINDYEVLYLIKENSDSYIDLLYEKYKPYISKTIKKWTGILSIAGVETEDIKQECYLAFSKAVKEYDENNGTLFYTYVTTMIDYHLHNYLKSLKTNKNFANSSPIYLHDVVSSDDEKPLAVIDMLIDETARNPLEIIEEEDIMTKIKNFMYSLDIKQSSVLELYMNGYRNVDIAKLLDIQINNVSVIINRILKKLKKYIETSCTLVL